MLQWAASGLQVRLTVVPEVDADRDDLRQVQYRPWRRHTWGNPGALSQARRARILPCYLPRRDLAYFMPGIVGDGDLLGTGRSARK